jgi:hypothetical protein
VRSRTGSEDRTGRSSRSVIARPAVQERKLPQALLQNVPVKLAYLEDFRIRLEPLPRPVPVAFPIFLSFCTVIPRSNFICQRNPSRLTSVIIHSDKRIDDGDADAVKAARHFIAALSELRAGVENRHDDFHGRQPFLGVKVDRDAASVVFHRARPVGQQYDLYVCAYPAIASSTALSTAS